MNVAEATALRSVVARHTIDATPEEVFRAWVEPELIAAWWGPEGVTTTVLELEPHEGGRFSVEMTALDGTASRVSGFYREISPPNRVVLEFTEHCNATLPAGVEPQLEPSVVTAEFLARGAHTEVVVTHSNLRPSYAELVSFGWSGALRKLATAVTVVR